MRCYIEDVVRLCEKYSSLAPDDVAIILKEAGKIGFMADTEQRDLFINILTNSGTESISVALAHCDDTMYELKSLGVVIRDEDEPAVLRTLRYGVETRDMCARSYTTTDSNRVVQDVSPIKNGDRTIAALVKERRLKQAEIQEWSRSDTWIQSDYETYPYLKYLDWLADCIDDAVIVVDAAGSVVFRNARAKTLYHEYGYIYDIYGKNYNSLSMHGPIVAAAGIDHAFYEEEFKSGGHYYHIKQYCYKDEAWFYIVVIRDITREKEQQETLVLKSVAVREAHHRIKNNLQTIYSLLDMQRRRMTTEEGMLALQETMGRIMSISTSYESLLMCGHEQVNVLDVIGNVKEKFSAIIRGSVPEIEITVSGDDVYVDADGATDIAMIINELLQNSFKYAFQGRSRGRIDIRVEEKALYSVVTVTDDGIGFDSQNMEQKASGMGLQIARNLVRGKLKGKFNCKTDPQGTSVTFDFKHQK